MAPATATYDYDALDRLTSVTRPWAGAGGGSSVTSYQYDVQDHLTSVTDAEMSPTTYAYSDRDLLTQEESLVSGTTNHALQRARRADRDDRRPRRPRGAHGRRRGPRDLRRLPRLRRRHLDTTYTYGEDPLVAAHPGAVDRDRARQRERRVSPTTASAAPSRMAS